MRRCSNCFSEFNEGKCSVCGYAEGEHVHSINLRPGTIVGKKYIVGKLLGSGGFGNTYLAFDTEFEVKVAIKEFYPKGILVRTDDRKTLVSVESEKENYRYGLDKFINEAEILEKFKEALTIVAVEDVFKENGTAYMVMEYLEGMTLEEKLKNRDKPMNEKEVVQVIYPLLNTLAKVHAEGLIHRDISPDNIYIRDNGQIKLLDFGSARYSLGQQTKNLSVLLKHGYAPPEQYASKGRQGPWTDIYAVAATMYTMLTQKQLLSSLDYTMGEEVEQIKDVNPSVSEAFAKIVHKGLSLKYQDRYQDVLEMLEDLGEATGISFITRETKAKRSENRTVLESSSTENPGSQEANNKGAQEKQTTNWVHQSTLAFDEDSKETEPKPQKEKTLIKERRNNGKGGWIIAIAIIFVLVVIYFASPFPKYFAAKENLNEGKYKLAVTQFEVLDGFLDSEDQIETAIERAYSDGSIYYNDDTYESAYTSYEFAANYGYVEAQYMMGYMLERGLGVDKDLESAKTWYNLAAQNGDSEAEAALEAILEAEQEAAEAAAAEAAAAEAAAAAEEEAAAVEEANELWDLGHDAYEDEKYSLALYYYEESANLGDLSAMEYYAHITFRCDISYPDYEQAFYYLLEAESLGRTSIYDELALAYENGYGTREDQEKAFEYYKLSADIGNMYSQDEVGYRYYSGKGVTKSYSKAKEYWELAAEQNYYNSICWLGVLYKNGDGVAQDYDKAMENFVLAAGEGVDWANREIGYMYEYGLGVDVDKGTARTYYYEAIVEGDEYAGSYYVSVVNEIAQELNWDFLIAEDYDEDTGTFSGIGSVFYVDSGEIYLDVNTQTEGGSETKIVLRQIGVEGSREVVFAPSDDSNGFWAKFTDSSWDTGTYIFELYKNGDFKIRFAFEVE